MSDILKLAAVCGASLSLCAEGQGAEEEAKAIEAEARIYFAIPGIVRPEDWDELSASDKKERIEKVRKFALGERPGV